MIIYNSYQLLSLLDYISKKLALSEVSAFRTSPVSTVSSCPCAASVLRSALSEGPENGVPPTPKDYMDVYAHITIHITLYQYNSI